MAARENGLSFEQIAVVLERAQLPIAAETLRSYLFELKTEAELASKARRHASRVTATKQTIDRQLQQIHDRHAQQRAYDFTSAERQAPWLYDAFADGPAAAAAPAAASTAPAPV